MYYKRNYNEAALFVRSYLNDLVSKRQLSLFVNNNPALSYDTLYKFKENSDLVYPDLVLLILNIFGLEDVSYDKIFNFTFLKLTLNYDKTTNLILPSLNRLTKNRKLSSFSREHNLKYPTLNSLKNQKLPYKYPKFLLNCLKALDFHDVVLVTDYIYTYKIPDHLNIEIPENLNIKSV